MRPHNSQPLISEQERTREIARLLAIGLRRLRDRHALIPTSDADPTEENSLPNKEPNCLELPRKTRLSVTRVNDRETPKFGRPQ